MLYSNETIRIYGLQVKQVNKTTARKLWEQGQDILLHPCNLTIFNAWQQPAYISNENQVNFDTLVNEFSYYNCDNERGKRVLFFAEINPSEKRTEPETADLYQLDSDYLKTI